jgi:hypothetical protein
VNFFRAFIPGVFLSTTTGNKQPPSPILKLHMECRVYAYIYVGVCVLDINEEDSLRKICKKLTK